MSVKNIRVVLFGQSGAGKSSVVNLIAGQEVAEMSLDMVLCTMHWQEHVITFGGCTYKVFDTMGLDFADGKIGSARVYANSNARNDGGVILSACTHQGT